jgi:hypothetical protein
MPIARVLLAALALLVMLLLPSCNSSSPTEPPSPSPACSFQVTAPADALPPEGGTLTLTITTAASCGWTVRPGHDWITVASNATGTGSGTSVLSVAANGATALREGTVTVETQTLRLTQRGRIAACTYAVSSEGDRFGPDGGSRRFTVTTAPECGWSAVSTESWVTLDRTSGTGTAEITYTVAPFTGDNERAASIRVNDRTLSIRQDPVRLECSYSVEPTQFDPHWHGLQNAEVRLTTTAGCRWTVRSTAGWLTFDGPAERDGSDVVRFSTGIYLEDSTRRAPLEFRWDTPTAGQNVWVEQGGCRYGMDHDTRNYGPAAVLNEPVTVVTQPVSPSCAQGCPWTATSDVSWITITSSMPRAGDDVFRYSVLANPNPGTTRQGRITMREIVLVINQN